MVASAIRNNGCQPASGFGVVGCLEYVRWVETVATLTTINHDIFPKVGQVQPIGFLDSRSGAEAYIEEPKVGGSDVLPDYDSATPLFVDARSWRVNDQDAEAWRAGINLFGAVPVVIDPNTKMSFDLRNNDGAATVDFEFYWLFLRAS